MTTLSNGNSASKSVPTWAWIVFGALSACFIVAVIARLVMGPAALEVSSVTPWGAFIALFFFLVGIGGGLMLLGAAGILSLLPQVKEHVQKIFIGAFACLAVGGLMIVLDLGRPDRVLNMILFAQVGSMFFWDFVGLMAALIVSAICIVVKPRTSTAIAAIIAAVFVIVVEGAILSTNSSREFWYSALTPVLFLLEGCIGAAAVYLVVFRGEEKRLPYALAVLMILFMMFGIFDLFYGYSPTDSMGASLSLLLVGELAPIYWTQKLVFGVLPIVLLIIGARKERQGFIVGGAALALVGTLLAKTYLLLAAQMISFAGETVVYMPTFLEVVICCGSIGLVAFLYCLGVSFLPGWLNKSSDAKAVEAPSASVVKEA